MVVKLVAWQLNLGLVVVARGSEASGLLFRCKFQGIMARQERFLDGTRWSFGIDDGWESAAMEFCMTKILLEVWRGKKRSLQERLGISFLKVEENQLKQGVVQ